METTIEGVMNKLMLYKMRCELSMALESLNRSAYAGDLSPFKRIEEGFKDREGFLTAAVGMGNKDGMTNLHFAASGGRENVIQFLLDAGKLDIDDKDWIAGETPLHHAIKERRFSTVVFLLENGADPNARTKKRRTSLHYAVEHGSKDLIELLISKGAEINAVAVDCGTPLHLAVGNGRDEFVKLLLDHHADSNVTSQDMFSPLMESIRAESLECMELLLKAGADPNFCGYKGRTPLGYAASEGLKGIVNRLLKAGADPNATNRLGMTPLEEAALKDQRRVVTILFPLTSLVPTIPKWSFSGLFNQVNSDEARKEREQKVKELFLLSKSKGAECFNRKDYLTAVQWYTQALLSNSNDAAVLSERSLCWARLHEGALALEDAEHCIKLRPKWAEAHYRAGSAKMLYTAGDNLEEAADSFVCALTLDPVNKAFHRALRDANEVRASDKSFSLADISACPSI